MYVIEEFSTLIWFLTFFIFIFIEIKSKEMLFIYFSISSILAGIISIFIKSIDVEIVVFIITSLILIIFIKTIVDKIIEMEVKFKDKKHLGSNCIIMKKCKNKDFYQVLTSAGIYRAKNISKNKKIRKFNVCRIIYNDGSILIITKAP